MLYWLLRFNTLIAQADRSRHYMRAGGRAESMTMHVQSGLGGAHVLAVKLASPGCSSLLPTAAGRDPVSDLGRGAVRLMCDTQHIAMPGSLTSVRKPNFLSSSKDQ